MPLENPVVDNGGGRLYPYLDEHGRMVSPYDYASHNALSGSFNGNSTNVFSDWLFPQTKEARQNAAQLEMERLTPQYKMEGMIDAGINPLTSASGVAGSQATSAQPASSVNPIGDVAGAVGAAAGGFNSVAAGISALKKLNPEVDNIKADTKKKFSEIGLTDAETEGVITDNKYRDDNWKAELNVKRQQFENMKVEWNNIVATHSEILKHIEEMQSTIELQGSQEDYFNSMHHKLDEETRFLKEKNDFCLRNKLYLLESGLDGYIFSMVQAGADMSQFDKFIDIYSNYREQVSYHTQRGANIADVENAFNKAFNEALGNAEVNAAFKPFMDHLDLIKENAINMFKELYKYPNNPIQLATKFVDLILKIPEILGMDADYESVPRDKPVVRPKNPN